MRAEIFGFKPMTGMDLGERAAEFALKLGSFFTIVIVKIFSRGRAYFTNRVVSDFSFVFF